VAAQIQLKYSVNGYGITDLAAAIKKVPDTAIDKLASEYDDSYAVAAALRPGGERRQSLREAARIELGLRFFLGNGGFKAFTDTFEDLHGLEQLPGIAVQRLMAEGTASAPRAIGNGGAGSRDESDGPGLPGGTSFMEDTRTI